MTAARELMVAGVLVAFGCPGDDGGTGSSTDASSSGASSSTVGPETSGVDSTSAMTGMPNTSGIVTGGAEDGSGTTSGNGTDTGVATSAGTGTDTGSATDSGGDSTTGPQMLGPYGDCVGAMLPCPDGSFCLLVPGSGVCTPDGCTDANDCPAPPPGGNASVTCLDANGDDVPDCRIDCSGGQTCPNGMQCFSDEICVWS